MATRSKGGRRGRWLRRVLLGLAALLVLLGASAAFLVGTGPGGRVVLSVARGFMPHGLNVEVDAFSGRLVDRFELAGVRFETPTVRAEAGHVIIEWKGLGLLSKRIDVRMASVEGLEVAVQSPPPDASSGGPGEAADSTDSPPGAGFPYAVSFDSVRVSDLTFRMRDSVWISGGNVALSGTPDEYRLSFQGHGAVPGLVAAEVTLAGSGSLTGFQADTIYLATLEGVIAASTDATWWPELSWVARLEADDLEPAPLLPEPDAWPGRVSFSAATKGRMSHLGALEAEASIDTLFGVLRGERVDGRFNLRASGKEVDIDAARISWGPASVSAAGRVGETIEAEFQADVPDLGLLWPGASGRLSASGRATGTAETPRLQATYGAESVRVASVSAATVEGEADIDLSGQVSGTVEAHDVGVSGRSLDSARVVLSGRVDRHELAATAWGPKLGLDLEAAGSLSSSHVWSGTLRSLQLAVDSARTWALEQSVALTASADAFELGEACFASQPARICLSGRKNDRLTRIRVAADSVDLARLEPLMPAGLEAEAIVDVAADVEYTSGGELTGTADVRSGPGQVEWARDGEVRTLRFEPITLTAASGPDGTRGELELHLTDSAQARLLDVSGDIESPVAFRAIEDFSRLRGQPVSLRLSIESADLSRLTADVLPLWDLTGRFSAVVDLDADAEGLLNGSLDARADSLVFRNTVRGHGWVLSAEPARLQATVGPDGLAAALDVKVSTTGSDSLLTARGRVSIPGLTSLDVDPTALPMEGRLDVELADLSIVEAILAELTDASGTFGLHTELAGTLADATVKGEALLSDGRALVPSLGLELTGVQLAVAGRPEGGLDVDGEIHSGSGQITIRGRSERYPSAESPTRIQIRGEDFRAADIPELQIDANPTVEVLFDGSTLQLDGQVLIPRARVGIPELPAAAVTPSEDVIILGDTTTVREPPVPFRADFTVTLGDNVFFEGVGLTGNLVGELNVTQRPGGQPTGRGELRLNNGIYRTLGQELRIDPGRLLFNGPIDDPGVDARAFVRASDQTEAGFQIRGTLQNLDVSTYSVPPKTESDIMAYILFGRPMSETTGTEGSQATNTAAVLGANMLAMSLAPSIGLDEARIDTGSSQNKAQLVVGKYLSPKLYIGYGVGLYEPISTFRVRYLLSARWSIEAITGDQQSTDLLYRIERGGSSSEGASAGDSEVESEPAP